MKIEQKREIFLREFRKKYKKSKEFDKYCGPGIKKKIQRILFNPHIYIPYIFWRLSLYPRNQRKIKLFFGKKLTIDIVDYDIFMFSQFGSLVYGGEKDLTEFFIKNLKENDIFYDVGANYGFYTYLALEFCQEVHSFEPIPNIYQALKSNNKNNPKVFINNFALSDKNKDFILYSPKGKYTACSTIIPEAAVIYKYNFGKQIKIKAITLDTYLKSHNSPTVIKLDVEGAESLVIEGGKEFFKNNSPIIAMEVWSKDKGGEISMRAVEKLREFGYQSYTIKEGELEKIDSDLSEVVLSYNLDGYNFIFKK